MKNNMSELTNKIMQEHESIAAFCTAAGIVNTAEFEQELSKGDLSAEHIKKAAQALDILPEEIGFYFFRPASDPTIEELYKVYAQLTPENKKKAIAKYHELLAEQERQEAQEQPVYYYFFDCLDGALADRYLTARELSQLVKGAPDPMSEKEIKSIARNYEATLYRYTMDENGNPQNEQCIYDPFDM